MIRSMSKQITGILKSVARVLGIMTTKKEEKNWVHVASWFPETRDKNEFD